MLYASFDAVTVGTGIDVDLPKAATVSAKERDDVIITITKNQQMYFNDKQVSRNELQAYIAEALKDDPDKPIVIKADEQVTYDKIILVMDMVGQAGGYKFLLAAERLQR
jgi:biopolymer transport protein ExbD